MKINFNLKKLLEENNTNKTELCANLKLPKELIEKWESGEVLPELSHLPDLALFFHISIEHLLGVNIVFNNQECDEILLKTGTQLLEMCFISRKKGLLALEQYVLDSDNSFLKDSIECILAYSPEVIRAVLNNKFILGNFDPFTYIENSMIKDAIIAITKGNHPINVINIICSYFNEDQKKRFINLHSQYFFNKENFYSKLKHKKVLSEKTVLLEEIINKENVDDTIRLLDIDTLTLALHGASGDIVKKLTQGMPDKLLEKIYFNLYFTDYVQEDHIIDAQKKILEKLNS